MPSVTVNGGEFTHASANLMSFILDALNHLPDNDMVTRMAATATSVGGAAVQPPAVGRRRFHVTFALTGQPGGDLGLQYNIVMPDRPLAEVNYGSRDDDKPWAFPRLHIDTHSLWWQFGAQLIGQTLADGHLGGPRPSLAHDIRSEQHRVGGLVFGYNDGLPEDPFDAAWGCRAIVRQSGFVDILPDRTSAVGDRKPIERLRKRLRGGLGRKWVNITEEMLRSDKMTVGSDIEHVVLNEDGIVVKARPRGAYLYVCAYLTDA